MDEEMDIVMLAVPFAVGVAAGALLSSVIPPGSPASWILPAVTLPVTAVLTCVCASCPCRRAAFIIPMMLLGLFCRCSCGLMPPGERAGWKATEQACGALKEMILGLPFRDGRPTGLILALLTGDKSGLPRETVTLFRDSGAAHILALSGLHLGIIYSIIRKLFSIAGNSPSTRKLRCTATIAATLFYTVMTGAGPSIVRAFLFITISELSSISPERRRSPVRVLATGLTVQLALSPTVIGNIGFQLSYLAILGMVTIYPALRRCYPADEGLAGRLDPMRRIWDAAAVSISCQAFTAPAAWVHFHTFPQFFLLTNIIALPLSTAVMGLAVAAIALSAAGICPGILISAVEWCTDALLRSLEIISSMG